MAKAIIVGASSGIGRELALLLSQDNYDLGLMARREHKLNELKKELQTQSFVKCIDISRQDEARDRISELIKEMEGVDLVIITSGTGHVNYELDWALEKETIDVNVTGVAAVIGPVLKHFESKGQGHLVVISSVACLRGSRESPSYSASKAFVSNYLEGVRCKVKKQNLDITITDIRPGLVDTEMAKGEGLFWVQPVRKASQQIYSKIKAKKDIAYITKRWGFIAFLLKYLPKRLLYKM